MARRLTDGTFARGTWARGLFPHQLSWLIDNRLRRLLLTPEKLADRLPLSEYSRILEVGPGSGYFSVELARRVPRGHLGLFDIQAEMLAKAKRKLDDSGFQNVSYTEGDASDGFPFAAASFDIAVLVSVLGEVSDREACLRSLYRVLRPGGVIAFHEAIPDPDLIQCNRLRCMAEAQGFRFRQRWGPSWNFTVTFERPATSA